MKLLRAITVAVLVLSAGAALASEAKFKGILKKYSVDLDAVGTLGESLLKARTPCLCFDPARAQQLGYLVHRLEDSDGTFRASCYLPVFLPDGSLNTIVTCTNYALVGK